MVRKLRQVAAVVWFGVGLCGLLAAQTPPTAPTPTADATYPNLWYGAVPPGGSSNPVLFFVHGLSGHAEDWWVGNDMYNYAYAAGYRTAFISMSADNSRNTSGIAPNAQMFTTLLPVVTQHYGVQQLFLVTHSKGGIDVTAAMLNPSIAARVKAVLQLSPPNHGTKLADWAFGAGQPIAQALGLDNPGVYSMQTTQVGNLRTVADPVFQSTQIPFYYVAGTSAKGPGIGGIVTQITGAILASLGGIINDGLVPLSSTKLPVTYGFDLGTIAANHFTTLLGNLAFPRINAQIQALDNYNYQGIANFGFQKAMPTEGFGDRNNSLAWSQAWFNGKLYVGTGRAFACTQAAASDALSGTHYYKANLSPSIQCTPTPQQLPLQAEIWQYTPETNTWVKVYTAPNDVPVAWNSNGQPTGFTSRDIGYRGMGVFQEPTGPALYIGGISASEMFDQTGPYGAGTQNFPPPRILRTTDGQNFAPIPQDPGTFLGDIGNGDQNTKVRSFRTFIVYNGKLLVTAADFYGTGVVIAASQPWLGDNAFQQVSPSKQQMPVWNLAVMNNYLYAITGSRLQPTNPPGYAVYKTNGQGIPFNWIPIVTSGGYQTDPNLLSDMAIGLAVFNNALYVGTDRPAEMIRVYPDDSWDVVVGPPRQTPSGMKYPLSGINTGFDNMFTGHFWRFAVYNNKLYMGTWDWSSSVLDISGLSATETFLANEFGTDVYQSSDGIHWSIVTKHGFGVSFNDGSRTIQPTPFGLFVGTMNNSYGCWVYRDNSILDLNGDGAIDQRDIGVLMQSLNQTVPPGDPRDLDQDGKITVVDARQLATQCNQPGCAIVNVPQRIAPPQMLTASTQADANHQIQLSWQPVAGATAYHVFRLQSTSVAEFLPYIFPPNGSAPVSGVSNTIPGLCSTLQGNALCSQLGPAASFVPAFASTTTLPSTVSQPVWVGTTDANTTTFQSLAPPSGQQNLYFVKAEDANGQLSSMSNLAGAPSLANPTSSAVVH